MGASKSFFYRILKRVGSFLCRLLYRHQTKLLFPWPEGKALVIANHTSYLDPIFIALSAPEELHFLARANLFEKFWLAPILRLLNAHPISPEGINAQLHKIIGPLLAAGKKVVIFPEGTRSANGQILPFKEGAAWLSLKFKAPLLPLYLEGIYQVWPRKQSLPRPFGKTAAIFGAPIMGEGEPSQKEKVRALTQRLEAEVRELAKSFFRSA